MTNGNKVVEAKDYFSEAAVGAACKTMCFSGKFETGEGGCAPICMSGLGSSRTHCAYRVQVHKELALQILTAAHGL